MINNPSQMQKQKPENITDSMESFYASLEEETTSLSHLQDTRNNAAYLKTRPSSKAQKALQILRDFVSKRFHLLLHPGRCRLMKDTLSYLLSLPPDGEFTHKTKSVILQLSRSYAQWSLDYDNASLKLKSAVTDLRILDKVEKDLEVNFKDFRDSERIENQLCTRLACLEERKRELEVQINAIKAEIAELSAERDEVVKRKGHVFDNGRVLKDERDDLRNAVPRLKAEEEWAKIIQKNIEAEWLKLGEQFIRSASFEELI